MFNSSVIPGHTRAFVVRRIAKPSASRLGIKKPSLPITKPGTFKQVNIRRRAPHSRSTGQHHSKFYNGPRITTGCAHNLPKNQLFIFNSRRTDFLIKEWISTQKKKGHRGSPCLNPEDDLLTEYLKIKSECDLNNALKTEIHVVKSYSVRPSIIELLNTELKAFEKFNCQTKIVTIDATRV
ncbi:hypothetical protein P9112_001948 [Eukaryota sp. TZLM1-RC]